MNTMLKCGIGDCRYQTIWAKVLGRHKRDKHGILGSSASAVENRKARAQRPTLLERSNAAPASQATERLTKLKADIMRLHREGHSYIAIGKMVGVTGSTVGYHILRAQGYIKPSRMPKAAAAPIRYNKLTQENTNGTATSTEAALANHVSYLFGRTEAQIEAYCDGAGISRAATTEQLAELLRRKARRALLGA